MKERWHKTFLGVRQQHTYWLYKVIDDVLMENPGIKKFVEIGTGNGALSAVLGFHAVTRGGSLFTIDKQERGDLYKLKPLFDELPVQIVRGDCFEATEQIKEYMGDDPCFFFCDGDDKPKQFNHFTPLIPAGSVIAAHDFTNEFDLEDIKDTVDKYELTPLVPDDWDGGVDDIQTCFFLKRGDIDDIHKG